MATKTVRIQQQHQHEQWGQQAWHRLHQQEWHEQPRRAQAARVSRAHRARWFRRHTLMAHAPHWLKMFLGPTSLHRHTCVVLLDLAFLPSYFDLSFSVFFHSSVLMHPEHYTDLDNFDIVQSEMRHSANGSNDAYDDPISLTERDKPIESSKRNGEHFQEWTYTRHTGRDPRTLHPNSQLRQPKILETTSQERSPNTQEENPSDEE